MRYAWSGLLWLAASTAIVEPAHAQFYHLDGRYDCLKHQGAVCYDASVATPPAAPAREAEASTVPQTAATPEIDHTLDDLKAVLAMPAATPAAPADPLRAIVARIDAKTPTPADFAKLEADARAGDMRAVELLAWCAYAGIGGPPDPIRAYFLYGRAAAAGLTAMARNQATVYATMLSSEQRQQIAEIENSQ